MSGCNCPGHHTHVVSLRKLSRAKARSLDPGPSETESKSVLRGLPGFVFGERIVWSWG